MKGYRLPLLIIAVVFLAAAPAAFGQVNANLDAQANLQASYTVTAVTPLNFGDIVPDADGGTVLIDTAGGRILTGVTGGTPEPGNAGTFDVFANQALLGYSISFTDGVVGNGTDVMAVTLVTRTGAANGAIDFPAGLTTTISYGGTLTIGNNQPTGAYTTGAANGVPIVVSVFP